MPRLESSIKKHLNPTLKNDGFVGFGRTFRRVSEDLIHVVQVQGSRYGGKFAINLGIQPRSIPDVAGNSPDPMKIREELCEFRRRLSETRAINGGNTKGQKRAWTRPFGRQHWSTRQSVGGYSPRCPDQNLRCKRSRLHNSRPASIAFQASAPRRFEWRAHWRS
ncbi:DUF4304 domain-containing protein [Bradyrhizobium sp. NBAIM03]|nr:DUF4304 domain-containing protein [Bradyrhizobium sp. NBAIM14]MCA1536302.1 DUF4304 domain-containing protein [Bradyrhizobium sp. NBAIM03]